MEISAQIKKHRSDLALSQEELAGKLYVTRQSVSNWETGKTYPDLQSLLRMSQLFGVSLDQLVKGDMEEMKQEIKQSEIEKLYRYSAVYALFLLAALVAGPLAVIRLGRWGLLPAVALYAAALYWALKVEKVKKENDLSTYKEIMAFSEGRRLDQMESWQEKGKRPYQRVLAGLAGAAAAALSLAVLVWLFG